MRPQPRRNAAVGLLDEEERVKTLAFEQFMDSRTDRRTVVKGAVIASIFGVAAMRSMGIAGAQDES